MLVPLLFAAMSTRPAPIDRHALVTRHNVTLTQFDGERPMQVGNGEFAFGMDITGLQTFAPFNTMSQWGWHSGPPPVGEKVEDYEGQVWDTHGRPVRYPMFDPNHPAVSEWLAGSPHRINLGRIGLVLTKADGEPAEVGDLKNARQTLELWNGIVTSRFELEGVPVTVKTAAHPTTDAVAAQVESPLIRLGRLAVFVDCPGDNPLQFANFVGDWNTNGRLEVQPGARKGRVELVKRLEDDQIHLGLSWKGGATLVPPTDEAPPLEIVKAEYGAQDKWADVTEIVAKRVRKGRAVVHVTNDLLGEPIHGVVKTLKVTYAVAGKRREASAQENEDLTIDSSLDRRRFTLRPSAESETLAFTCTFSPKALPEKLPDATATFAAARRSWPTYWKSGGAIDLSESQDPRWRELERRIVLSQYLMAVNEAGSYPPQESGLVNNGWFGRFHMEMYWWHAAQWALWNRWPQLNRSLNVYKDLLPGSSKLAKSQGYLGARWPKAIGPGGREWPHVIHSLLIWQQPHPIFFAELDYRAHPTRATLEKWRPVVEATADFMASYAFHDEKTKRYVLGPPVYVVSENADPKTTQNPTFELGYWRFGLRTAQEWRARLGLPAKAEWTKVLKGLSPLPVQDGLYVLHEGVADMWTKWNFEHPALTGVLGMLPGDGVDRVTMRRTLDKVAAAWDFNRTWGWDFPMLAMCASRLGEPERAIDFLLTSAPGFQFDARGLATGGPFPYFPSNGALLYAVAQMAAGWEGAPKGSAPGFPATWNVRFEGLSKSP
jgi:hypothetical protein